jgi:predicted nucleic acid-binding protein
VERLKYLVDSNIWLELLLNQQKADVVQRFFQTIPTVELAVSEFTVCSIGLILTRLDRPDVWRAFVTDVLENGALRRIALDPSGLREMMVIRQQFRLDFDDAYQYVAAQQHGLTLVSFDSDFDKTFLGRKSPEEVLSTIVQSL